MPAAIASQSTAYGRLLNVAHVMGPDGHLLLPYGDYGANTGPVDVIGYRPSDGDVVTYFDNLNDERIEDYRRLNGGALWTCPVDPRGRDDAVLATNVGGSSPSAWHAVPVAVPSKGPAVHLFDVAQTSDGDLFVCLVRNYTPAEKASRPGADPDDEYNSALAVWRRPSGSSSWVEEFVDLKDGDGYYRPYGFGRVGDDLVLPNSDGAHWVRHDGVWSAKRTAPVLYIYRPPIWSVDGQAFATSNNSGVVFTVTGGLVTSYVPYAGFSRAIGAGPAGWVWLDNHDRLHYGATRFGTVPPNVDRAVVDEDGAIYLSDTNTIKRVDV